MKRLIIVLLIFPASFMAGAQDWYTNFESAKEKATSEDKLILMVFQGSDWCAPCIKLSREVWETEAFRQYAADHFIMVQVDFPRRKQNALPEDQQTHNAMLAERYNQNGIFPLVVILTPTGKVIGETGYMNYSPDKYIDHLNSFSAE